MSMSLESEQNKLGDLTQVLSDVRMGKVGAERALIDRVHSELRGVAAAMMARERADHTLQTTALVNEAYLRLLGKQQTNWENRAHFFGAAARAMRQILVDYARRTSSAKRGDRRKRVELTGLSERLSVSAEDVVAINDALDDLAEVDQRKARIVELRFFAGLDVAETAEVLDVSPRTVKRDWSFARAWLSRYLLDDATGNGGDGKQN